MNWKKIDERYRYFSALAWMNTFGLIFEIISLIKINQQTKDIFKKEVQSEELRKSTAKLMLFVGIVLFCIYLWIDNQLLIIASIILIILGLLGRLASGLKSFIDEFIG
jgi:hypothetical protein